MKKLLFLVLLVGVFFGQDTLVISELQTYAVATSDTIRSSSILLDEDYLYFLCQNEIYVFDVSDNDTLILDTVYTEPNDEIFISALIMDSLLVVNSYEKLFVFDKDPASMRLYASIGKYPSYKMKQYVDTLIFLVNNSMLFAVNLKDPEAPETLSVINHGSIIDSPIAMFIQDTLLNYTTDGFKVFKSYNLKFYPDSLHFVSQEYLHELIFDMEIFDDTLCLMTGVARMSIFNINRLDSIYKVSSTLDSNLVREIFLYDTLCYKIGNGFMEVDNIANLDTTFTIGRYHTDQYYHDIAVDDYYAYCTFCSDSTCDSLIIQLLEVSP